MHRNKIITLKNGLRVLLINQPQALTVTALVLVGTGSQYEQKIENGLSHFLEHMCFKGTINLPTSREVVESFDRVGAISNAFTSNEYTGYYAKGSPKNLNLFIKVLGDIYQNSTLPEDEIEREKGVIIEEVNMYEDMPQQKVGEILSNLLYGDQPAGWPILGSKENIRNFKREDFIKYKLKHYHANNTVLVVSGSFNNKNIIEIANKSFGQISDGKKINKKKVNIKKEGLKTDFVYKKTDQAHIAIGFHSFSIGHEDVPAASLLATILGRGMSSRLFQLLREDLGVAYYVAAGQENGSDHGVFEIATGVDKNRINVVLDKIALVLRDLKENLISDRELTKALQYRLGTMRLGLESSDEIAAFYGVQMITKNSFKNYHAVARDYKAVKSADIQRIAQKLFVASNTHIAIVSSVKNQEIDPSPFLSL